MSDSPTPGDGYWYLAGPYSDSPDERYKQHMDATALLIKHNFTIFSTIVHCHPMAHTHKMPTDAVFWQNYNHTMITPSLGVILLCLANWAESAGVREELNFCKIRDIPVWALDPPNYLDEKNPFIWTKML